MPGPIARGVLPASRGGRRGDHRSWPSFSVCSEERLPATTRNTRALPREGTRPRRSGSELHRRAATAAAGRVRIVELEPRSVDAFDVVDLRILEVLEAQRIDVELHSIGLELLVDVGDLILEVEVVGEPRASTADDTQA